MTGSPFGRLMTAPDAPLKKRPFDPMPLDHEVKGRAIANRPCPSDQNRRAAVETRHLSGPPDMRDGGEGPNPILGRGAVGWENR